MKERPLLCNANLMDAIQSLEMSPRRIAIVVDKNNKLLGTLTDGDIRRHLLSDGYLNDSVLKVMNTNPVKILSGTPNEFVIELMKNHGITAIPLVDSAGKFDRVIHLMDLAKNESIYLNKVKFSFAVIMAGGEGSRLMPLTKETPKPMIEIHGIPLLERQIDKLIKIGINKVYISINYLGHKIEEYFGNGSDLGIEILYLREYEKLGTGGALSLLPEKPSSPILLMNGDILTSSNFYSLSIFHQEQKSLLTVAAINYKINVPYGVLKKSGHFVVGLEEKPSEQYFCNAGIYVISPEILNIIPKVTFFNMTDLINLCLKNKCPVAIFPIHEFWSDIGTPEDLERARINFSNLEIP
jgi:dTDP-glucose pyrophosphorylase